MLRLDRQQGPQSRRAPHVDRADAKEASEQLVGSEPGAGRAAPRGGPHGARRSRSDRAGEGRRHVGRPRLASAPPSSTSCFSRARSPSSFRCAPRSTTPPRIRPASPLRRCWHRGADERSVAVAVEAVARVDVEALPVERRGDEPPRLERCYPRLDLHAAAGDVDDLARARADVGLGIERMELAQAADPPQHLSSGSTSHANTRLRGASISTVCSLRSIRSAEPTQAARTSASSDKATPSRSPPRPSRSGTPRRRTTSARMSAPAGRTRARSTSIRCSRATLAARLAASSSSASSSSRSPSRRPTSFAIARALPPTARAACGRGGRIPAKASCVARAAAGERLVGRRVVLEAGGR